MALINKSAILSYTLRELQKIPLLSSVGLFSYKRNRRVFLHKASEESYLIKVNGYVVSEKEISRKNVEKELRTIIKREFPRSRKIRFYRFSDSQFDETDYQKI